MNAAREPASRAPAGAPLLAVESLTVALPRGGDRAHAVENVSFELRAGEILCIVGESGSGKSVSANAIMGLLPAALRPTSGRILFKGRDLLGLSEPELLALRGRDIGMIFQEPMSALNPLMSVGEQIAEVMQVHRAHPGAAREARVLELLARVGLPDPAQLRHAYPFRLSGGQRQRVMIAMALALEPAMLIADEPTTALDVTTQAQILALIRELQASMGMGVMFITHDFGVVADIADRVAVMEKGVLVEQGVRAQVLDAPRHPYTRRLIAAVPRRREPDAAAPAEPAETLDSSPARPPAMRAASTAASEAAAPLLEVRGLSKTFTTVRGLFAPRRVVHAVRDVSFEVDHGETLGVVGESGSGKSTLGRCLLRLASIDAGRVLFRGHDLVGLAGARLRAERKHLQMIFQDPFASLNPRHTVGRIVTDGPIAHGASRAQADAKARELLRLVELDPSAFDRFPNEFSGGQRQRIGIARALALEPKLLVADESVSALDVSVQAQVLELLVGLQRRLDLGMIFITHDLRVAAQICHRILVMHQGEVVEEGTPAQIFEQPRAEYTRRLIDAIPGQAWLPLAARPAGATPLAAAAANRPSGP